MHFSRATEKYFEWMEIKNYSPATIKGRRNYLSYFVIWCIDRGLESPVEITRPILERYQKYLFNYRKKRDAKPLSFRSQHARVVPVRAFFKWLAKQGYILHNPASELELPRLEKRLPKHTLTTEEVERVMQTPDLETPMGIRDRVMLEVFYSTGMRRMELCNLSLWDLDFERGTVMIRQGKGKKDRMVPIGERAIKWIQLYIEEVRPQFLMKSDTGTLFLSQSGESLQGASLTALVRRYIDQADLGKRGSCHLFRHTMATLMHENGADIRHLQEILGHAKLDTTEIYTQVSIHKLKKVHELTHPGKWKKES